LFDGGILISNKVNLLYQILIFNNIKTTTMENKTLKTIIFAMTVLFAIYAYFNNPFSISSTPTSSEICMDYSKDKPSILKHSLVSEMIKNYRNNQLVSIQTAPVNAVANDAQSIWFHLDSIKKFIYHIEKGVQVNKPGSKTDLGLRIYYAAYSDKTTPTSYDKKHTLIMIPTLEIHGINADFNPIDINTYTGFDSPTNPFSTPGYVPMAMAVDVMAKNHGGLSPPATITGQAF
jgi:hypothetical protein